MIFRFSSYHALFPDKPVFRAIATNASNIQAHKKELLDKGIILPPGKIGKDKINLEFVVDLSFERGCCSETSSRSRPQPKENAQNRPVPSGRFFLSCFTPPACTSGAARLRLQPTEHRPKCSAPPPHASTTFRCSAPESSRKTLPETELSHPCYLPAPQ